jgi:hypothetical protein
VIPNNAVEGARLPAHASPVLPQGRNADDQHSPKVGVKVWGDTAGETWPSTPAESILPTRHRDEVPPRGEAVGPFVLDYMRCQLLQRPVQRARNGASVQDHELAVGRHVESDDAINTTVKPCHARAVLVQRRWADHLQVPHVDDVMLD